MFMRVLTIVMDFLSAVMVFESLIHWLYSGRFLALKWES